MELRAKFIDNQVLHKCIDEDPSAMEDLDLSYKKKVFAIAYKYTENIQDAEDLRQEVFLKLLGCLDIIENPGPWIAKVSKNLSLDHLKSIKTERDKKHLVCFPDIDDNKFNQPELQYIEREFKMLSEIEKLKTSNPQFFKGLERSIYYILHIYWFKEECNFKQKNVLPFIKARNILLETKNEVENIFGPPSKKEVMKIYRTLKPEFSKKDKNQIDKTFREPIHYLTKLQSLRGPFMKYYDENVKEIIRKHGSSPKKILEIQANSFPKQLNHMLSQLFFWDDNKEFFDLSCHYLEELIKKMDEEIQEKSTLNWQSLPEEFKNLLGSTDKLKIDPPTLIFRVWIKAFRKCKKTNLKLIKSLLLEFKKENKYTLWNPLFESLDESLNAETWRKKIYKPSANKKFYDNLSDLIYKKSFVEKVSINPRRE